MATLVALASIGGLFTFGPGPEKFYGQLLAKGERGGRVARDAWNFLGRVDAFDAGPAIGEFAFARKAVDLMQAGSAFRLLFINGYNWTFSVDFRGTRTRCVDLQSLGAAGAVLVHERARGVELGSGGGADVYLAMQNGAAAPPPSTSTDS